MLCLIDLDASVSDNETGQPIVSSSRADIVTIPEEDSDTVQSQTPLRMRYEKPHQGSLRTYSTPELRRTGDINALVATQSQLLSAEKESRRLAAAHKITPTRWVVARRFYYHIICHYS